MILKDNIKDTIEVIAANGGAVGISQSPIGQAKEYLTFISLTAAIAFTIYKFLKLKNK